MSASFDSSLPTVTCDELSLLFPHEKVADWISALEPELVLYRHYLLTLPALQRSQVIAKQIESGLDEYAFAVLVLSTFPHGYFTPTDRNDDGSEKKDKTVALVKEAARCYHENTPELHRAPRGRMHKLNGFMAFRSWICRAFRGATQRHISVLASNVWGEDPNHAQWELLAAAYNLLRDNFNMVDTTLVTFLTYTVNRFFHFPHNPHQYLARLGMIVSRRVNTGPEILYSLMSTPRAGSFTPPATNPTVPVIVEYCRNLNGYVEQIPNSSWPLNHMNGQKPFWAIPGVTDDPFLTTLAESEFDILDIYTEDDGTIPNNRLIHQPYSNWRQQLYHQQFMAAYNSLRP